MDDTPEEQTRDRLNGPVAKRRNDVDPGSGDQESAAPARSIQMPSNGRVASDVRASTPMISPTSMFVPPRVRANRGEGGEEEVERREVEER